MNKLLETAAKELGSRGGKKTKKNYGKEHYRNIQKLSVDKRRENKLKLATSKITA